jgi:hypothetical protein
MPTEPELREDFNIKLLKSNIKLIQDHINLMISEGEHDQFKHELKILELFPDFYDNYPFLVKKICKNEDMKFLDKMLNNLKQIENGEKTLPTVEMKLGTELANKYLYPNIK